MDQKNQASGINRIALFVFTIILTFCLYGCKKKSEDTGEYNVSYYYTPAESADQVGPIVVVYRYHCTDVSSWPDCNIIYYEDVPHKKGNWLSYPEDQMACSELIAVVTDSIGAEFTFIGYLVEPLQSEGMRATGTYTKELPDGTGEAGTFTAYSDFIVEGSGNPCPE